MRPGRRSSFWSPQRSRARGRRRGQARELEVRRNSRRTRRVSDDYGSHADFVSWVEESAPKRHALVEQELRAAFRSHIEMRETEFILLGRVSATALAGIILEHPAVLKPLLSLCNIAGRALAREIGIRNLNTYEPRLDTTQAAAIAGYIKPFLPPAVALC